MGVEVRWMEIARYWEETGWDQEFLWEFLTDDGDAAWLPLNEVIDEVSELFFPTDGPSSGALDETFDGFCSFFSPDGEPEEIREFFFEVGRRAEARGLSGAIVPWRGTSIPPWMDEAAPAPVLTAVVGLSLPRLQSSDENHFLHGYWALPEELTDLLVGTVLEWVDQAPGVAVMCRGMGDSLVPPGVEVGSIVRRSLPRSPVTLIRATEDDGGWCSGRFGTATTLQYSRPGELSVGSTLETLLEIVRQLGPWADVASVGWGGPLSSAWNAFDGVAPTLSRWSDLGRQPGLPFEQSPKTWATHVVDAYVAQVLTGQHLVAASLSSDWSVEDLGNDRFLVLHREPERWIDQVLPDPELLTQARTDFAPILFDPDTPRSR